MSLVGCLIGTTFFLGVLLVLLGASSLLRPAARGGGRKLAGIEITGRNGASMVLLVGAAFVASGSGWARTHAEAREQRVIASENRAVAEQAVTELFKATDTVARMRAERADLQKKLVALLPREQWQALAETTPALRPEVTDRPATSTILEAVGRLRAGSGR